MPSCFARSFESPSSLTMAAAAGANTSRPWNVVLAAPSVGSSTTRYEAPLRLATSATACHSSPLSGPTNAGPPGNSTATACRVVPTPGSTTHRNTVFAGWYGAAVASTHAPDTTFCGSTVWHKSRMTGSAWPSSRNERQSTAFITPTYSLAAPKSVSNATVHWPLDGAGCSCSSCAFASALRGLFAAGCASVSSCSFAAGSPAAAAAALSAAFFAAIASRAFAKCSRFTCTLRLTRGIFAPRKERKGKKEGRTQCGRSVRQSRHRRKR